LFLGIAKIAVIFQHTFLDSKAPNACLSYEYAVFMVFQALLSINRLDSRIMFFFSWFKV